MIGPRREHPYPQRDSKSRSQYSIDRKRMRTHGLWDRIREHLEGEYMNDNSIVIFSSLYMAFSFTERSSKGKCCVWRHFQFQSLAILLPSTSKCKKYYYLLKDLSNRSSVGFIYIYIYIYIYIFYLFIFLWKVFTADNILNIFRMWSVFSSSVTKFCVGVLYLLCDLMHSWELPFYSFSIHVSIMSANLTKLLNLLQYSL
jgi:hypothetical protein